MTLSTNLRRRGAIYYVRMRIPVDLCGYLKRTEVWKSLHTADPREAKRLAPGVMASIQEGWRLARISQETVRAELAINAANDLQARQAVSMGMNGCARLLQAWFQRELEQEWRHHHVGNLTTAPILRDLNAEIEDDDARLQQARSYAVWLADSDLENLAEDYHRGDYRRGFDLARGIFDAFGLPHDEQSQHFTILSREVMKAKGQVVGARGRWVEGDMSYRPIWKPELPESLFPLPVAPIAA